MSRHVAIVCSVTRVCETWFRPLWISRAKIAAALRLLRTSEPGRYALRSLVREAHREEV